MSLSRLSRRIFSSIHVRLMALFVAIFGTTLVLFSALLYRNFIQEHENNFDQTLFNYSIDVANSIKVSLFGDVLLAPNMLSDSEKVFPFTLGDTYLQIRTLNGNILARSRSLGKSSLPLLPDEREEVLYHRTLFRTIDAESMNLLVPRSWNYRMVVMLIEKPGGLDYVLQVAVPMRLLEREKRSLIAFFMFSIPGVLFIAAFGGLYFSRRALAPVTAITEKVKDITAKDLSERVPVPDWDGKPNRSELYELGMTLNDLLNRLQKAFEMQDAFLADASHQLKTPLAILRGEIDIMRSRPRSTEEMQDFLNSASQEVSYLSRMVENLLILAKTERGVASLAIQDFRLDEVILDSVGQLERVAAARGIRISVNLVSDQSEMAHGAFEKRGDPGLLRILFENIIENAIKYSPENSVVTVELKDEPEFIQVQIRDTGKGIDPQDLPMIFDRFYRVENREEAEARGPSGWGLGLAISKRIVTIHKGDISVESGKGNGACFTVRLPKASVA